MVERGRMSACSQHIPTLHGSVELLVGEVALCSKLFVLNKGFGVHAL